MVLNTKSCSLFTIPSKSSPREAMITVNYCETGSLGTGGPVRGAAFDKLS